MIAAFRDVGHMYGKKDFYTTGQGELIMKKALLVLVLLAVSTSAFAQVQLRGSAKFVCGKSDPPHINAWAFAPAYYYTTINVTNPETQIVLQGRKRFSVARLAQQPGPFTGFFAFVLGPGQSMQIDCGDIYAHLGIPPGTFIDGFVHLSGGSNYQATAVYTTSDSNILLSQDVEEVTIR
jgi:hypothetical protein